jgi:hypothetical protein
MIERFVELFELRALGHDALAHEERRLYGLRAARHRVLQGAVDQRLVQQHGGAFEEVAAAARDGGAVL